MSLHSTKVESVHLNSCQYPLINYLAPKSASAWGSVIFGLFIFYRETFWFDTALPELVRLISEEQGAALLEVNPRVHYAYCNYQEEGARGGCLLSRAVTCCCCVLMTKSKEKGIIMMENLKEVHSCSFMIPALIFGCKPS